MSKIIDYILKDCGCAFLALFWFCFFVVVTFGCFLISLI
mgnify:FL=1